MFALIIWSKVLYSDYEFQMQSQMGWGSDSGSYKGRCGISKHDCGLINPKQPSKYGKRSFIGCSNWSPAGRFDHICWPIPANCDEDTLKPVIQNNGLLPTAAESGTDTCVLTVHPRIGLKNCRASIFILSFNSLTSKLQLTPISLMAASILRKFGGVVATRR
jgi:hypothetical protein